MSFWYSMELGAVRVILPGTAADEISLSEVACVLQVGSSWQAGG